MAKIRYNAIEASKTFSARVKDAPKAGKVKLPLMRLSPTPTWLAALKKKNRDYGKLP